MLEYPDPLPNSEFRPSVTTRSSDKDSDGGTVSERLDPGHRHFSLLHWLYPSTLLPGAWPLGGAGPTAGGSDSASARPMDQVLADAAAATLRHKLDGIPRGDKAARMAPPKEGGGGGHTSW